MLEGGLASRLDAGDLLPRYFYRDLDRVRLTELVNSHDACEGLVLTTESRYAARRHRDSLAHLRTGRGVQLGDHENCLQALLGSPSERDAFGRYEILWYLGQPLCAPFDVRFHRGSTAGYALKIGRIVEIYLLHGLERELTRYEPAFTTRFSTAGESLS